ncbi:MAG: sigma-70 family RNA polymerase sigma factor, partial [Clostridiales bacterium]|nr:sigma-70 family RNA polymerase sigma factor [Clostridiales bacterium]
QRYIENSGHVMRIPVHRQEDIRKYNKAVLNFEMKWNRKPTDSELSTLLGMNVEKLDHIRKSLEMGQITSLDEFIKGDIDVTLSETIVSDADIEEQVIGSMNQQEVKRVLWDMVDTLPEDYPLLLRLRYQERLTYKVIGEKLGVTGDAIRQKEARAIKELSRSKRKNVLALYVDGYIKDMSLKGTGVERFRTTWTSATERTALKLLEKEYRYAQK